MRALLIPLLLFCTGCKAEPAFDERYAAAEKQLRAKERAIDDELAKRASEAAAQAPEPSVTVPPRAR